MQFLRRRGSKIAALILILFFGINLLVSSLESTTMDEKAHIPSAYSYVRYGDMRLNPEHPPLLKDLAGLALLPLQPDFPVESWEWQEGTNEQWVLGDKFINCAAPEEACNNADAVTFLPRIPIILVAVLLGFFIYLWTRQLAGTLAGLFALVLYAFDPNVIAHSHYVTTDIGIAAFVFFASYFFIRFLQSPTAKNVLLAGVFLALAQLTKFSAVLLFPVFGLFVLLYALSVPRPEGWNGSAFGFKVRQILSYGLKFTAAVAICFVIIYAYYIPHVMNMPGDKLVAVAEMMFPDRDLGPFAKSVIEATHENPVTKPLSAYLLGVFMVFGRVAGGNTYYFLGAVSNQASAWYFPVVFFLKGTLPFLFLLSATLLYTLFRIGKAFGTAGIRSVSDFFRFLGESIHGRIAQYLGGFFVIFYAFVSITGNLNIGFRHLFPILPFLYMLIAKTVFDAIKRLENEAARKVGYALVGILTLVIMSIPLLTFPSYLSYFNAAFGGHSEGYRYVTDSNYDWGQDLKRLRNFVEMHNRCASGETAPQERCPQATAGLPAIDVIRVDYFGGSNPVYYLGDRFVSWHSYTPPEPGWYALSANFLQESLHRTDPEPSYDWLLEYEPVTRAGDSIFIYYIPPFPEGGE